MENRKAKNSGLFGRPTQFDVGVGVLYFFTSHMVIRALYYVGIDRTPWELTVFFSHRDSLHYYRPWTRRAALAGAPVGRDKLRRAGGQRVGSCGCAGGSRVGAAGGGRGLLLRLGGALGFACGWIVVIWSSTIRPAHPDRNSFHIDPSLLVAVAVYFLFRCVSSLSEAVGEGFLLALPLVALACIVRSDKEGGASAVSERAQSLEVLVVVAAAFAVGCSLVVYLSGHESEMLSSGLNYMVLFEVLAVTLIICCCGLLRAFAERSNGEGSKVATVVTLVLCYGPAFAIGLLMGSAGIPSHSPDALWESNMWVLVIAIFAYDIRDSPYAVRGLAVGLMFEAMCVAQLIARFSTLDFTLNSVAVAVALAALYLLCVVNQLVRGGGPAGCACSRSSGAAAVVWAGVGQARGEHFNGYGRSASIELSGTCGRGCGIGSRLR
ncbi:MAG: LuxR family transcriptional regulator [Adlercreutzia equolifaciens]